MKNLIWVVLVMLVISSLVGPVYADTIYVIQRGDSLSRISAKFGVSLSTLMSANGLMLTSVIHPGQTLVIPDGASNGAASASSGGGYVVVSGDSLSRISVKLGVSLSALMSANGLTLTSVIHPGQTLVIPGGGSVTPTPASSAGVNHLGTEKVVIADYMMWYGSDAFDGNQTWDIPRDGAYNSDDYGTIQRHVAQAAQACLNGFAAHWYGPQEGRTTNNFNQLLRASAGTNLRHAVVIQTNILPGASEQMIIDAIKHVLTNWADDPNYLRLGGKPVIIFTDMPRPWGSDAAALEGWTRIRAAADPDHNAIWMAEGLYPTYNPLFDGLYVYRIDHRDYPQSWLKQSRWANGLRAVERQGNPSTGSGQGLPIGGLYFADTIAPGFDDTRVVNSGSDLRSPAPSFARDRRNGDYYADTFAATTQTGGDFLMVKSFNEWMEGTEIEPGATYGDVYLNLTCEYANTYRGR